ncbi:MAG TPA: carboxypeptidase-like regulatory domain-containing protein, partial [Vicinamibacterales bacterium]|nr:carboxypeptidase-like regulatory domain-containing protein [Vicinamibacterales bacterium]
MHALALAAALLSFAPAQPVPRPRAAPAASIRLTVTSRAGDPLAGVRVSATGAVERSGQTDAGGALVLRNLPPGLYRLRFEHQGFVTLEREVTVRAGRPAVVNVALSPAPAA